MKAFSIAFLAMTVFMNVLLASEAKTDPAAASVNWAASYEEGLAAAKKDKKLIFIDFYTDWCGPCKMMKAQVFPNPMVAKALNEFIPLQINAEKHKEIAAKYAVKAYPTLFILDSDANVIVKAEGAMGPPQFAMWLGQIKKAHGEFVSASAEIKAKPEDVTLQLKLANSMAKLNKHEDAKSLYEKVAKNAPATDKVSHSKADLGIALLDAPRNPAAGIAALEALVKAYPEQEAAKDAKNIIPQIHFMVAQQLHGSGKKKEAFAKLAEIVKSYPDTQMGKHAAAIIAQEKKAHEGHNHAPGEGHNH